MQLVGTFRHHDCRKYYAYAFSMWFNNRRLMGLDFFRRELYERTEEAKNTALLQNTIVGEKNNSRLRLKVQGTMRVDS